MAHVGKNRPISAEEFLELERRSDTRHEYFDGEIMAMSGAKRRHNLIVGNIVGELRSALRDRPCEVYPSGLKVQAPALRTFA